MTWTDTGLECLRWIGTIFQVVGAFVLAERLAAPKFCYAVMMVGAIAWLAAAVIQHETAMSVLMLAYCAINLRGLTRWAK